MSRSCGLIKFFDETYIDVHKIIAMKDVTDEDGAATAIHLKGGSKVYVGRPLDDTMGVIQKHYEHFCYKRQPPPLQVDTPEYDYVEKKPK